MLKPTSLVDKNFIDKFIINNIHLKLTSLYVICFRNECLKIQTKSKCLKVKIFVFLYCNLEDVVL